MKQMEEGKWVGEQTNKQKTGLMGDLKIYNDGSWDEFVYLFFIFCCLGTESGIVAPAGLELSM